jgi:hypothetical protein
MGKMELAESPENRFYGDLSAGSGSRRLERFRSAGSLCDQQSDPWRDGWQSSNFAKRTHYTYSMPTGAYITFSELFDSKASWEEIVDSVKGLPMHTAAVTLMRMNLVLRFALQEHNRPNFGRLQQMMVNDFTDADTFRRLQERFASTQTDQRPVFVPLAVLNVLRLVLVYARKDEPLSTLDDPALRFSLGTACLMMNNLLVSAEEERQIKEGDKDDRRLALLVQSLAPFELAFPPVDSHLLFRDGVIFRMLLNDTSVRARIAAECRGFDFKVEFEALIGISLERWLYVMFAIYSYYLQGGNAFDPHLEFSFLDPAVFAGQTQITPAELGAVLSTVSGSMVELRQEVKRDLATDPRFDFVPFRTHPLVPVSANRLACIDLSFVLEKLHTGVHWTMHDSYGNRNTKRDDLFKAWGILFEEYVHWLLSGMETNLAIKYFRPRWEEGGESFDGMLSNALIPKQLVSRPTLIPLSIEWPEEFYERNEESIYVEIQGKRVPFFEASLELTSETRTEPIRFLVKAEAESAEYEVKFSASGVEYSPTSAKFVQILSGPGLRKRLLLSDWFKREWPTIRYESGAHSTDDQLFERSLAVQKPFQLDKIDVWDWTGVNLKHESQKEDKRADSIQFRVIKRLLELDANVGYDVIFDDDNGYEAADIVAIKVVEQKLKVDLIHCKFSTEPTPGGRVEDLYVVCGQAQRSVHWKPDPSRLCKHLRVREQKRISDGKNSRFEKGDLKTLGKITSKASNLEPEFTIWIIQPGLSKSKTSIEQLRLLASTELYLKETSDIPLKVIASA